MRSNRAVVLLKSSCIIVFFLLILRSAYLLAGSMDCRQTEFEDIKFVINVQTCGIVKSISLANNIGHDVGLYFPEGVYDIFGQAPGLSSLFLEGHRNLTLFGDGDKSILLLKDTKGFRQVRTVTITNSHGIKIRDLKFDGNKEHFTDLVEEQQSNIFVRDTKELEIARITSVNAVADGLNVGRTEGILVESSHFDNNRRNGITIGQGASTDINIRYNYFGSGIDTQAIDFEHNTSSNVVIEHNFFERLWPEDSLAMDQYALVISSVTDAVIKNNTFNNPIHIRNSQQILLNENRDILQLTIDGNSKDVDVTQNTFHLLPIVRRPNRNFSGIRVKPLKRLCAKDIRFKSNNIRADKIENLLHIDGLGGMVVMDNMFVTSTPVKSHIVFLSGNGAPLKIYKNNSVNGEAAVLLVRNKAKKVCTK